MTTTHKTRKIELAIINLEVLVKQARSLGMLRAFVARLLPRLFKLVLDLITLFILRQEIEIP